MSSQIRTATDHPAPASTGRTAYTYTGCDIFGPTGALCCTTYSATRAARLVETLNKEWGREQPAPATGGEPITYTVDGVVMSPLEYIDYLHTHLVQAKVAGGGLDVEAERREFESECKGDYENMGGEFAGPGNQGWWYWSDETAAAWDGWLRCASRGRAPSNNSPAGANKQ